MKVLIASMQPIAITVPRGIRSRQLPYAFSPVIGANFRFGSEENPAQNRGYFTPLTAKLELRNRRVMVHGEVYDKELLQAASSTLALKFPQASDHGSGLSASAQNAQALPKTAIKPDLTHATFICLGT